MFGSKGKQLDKNTIMKVEMNDDPFIKVIKKLDEERKGGISQ